MVFMTESKQDLHSEGKRQTFSKWPRDQQDRAGPQPPSPQGARGFLPHVTVRKAGRTRGEGVLPNSPQHSDVTKDTRQVAEKP